MTYKGITLPRFDAAAFGARLCGDMRSNHAGETGAVAIYRGMLACSRDAELRVFAVSHLATEERHLEVLQAWLPPSYRSKLLPLWYLSGWILGAIAALGGRPFAFHTVSAVERFVIKHYEEQLSAAPGEVRELLSSLMADEAHHEADAAGRAGTAPGAVTRIWSTVVGRGSALAVACARLI